MLKKLVVTGLITATATQIYVQDTQAAEKDAANPPKVEVKDEAKQDTTRKINAPTSIIPHLPGESDLDYLKRMMTNPPKGAITRAILNKDGSITLPNIDPSYDILQIAGPTDNSDKNQNGLQIEPPAFVTHKIKDIDTTGDAQLKDTHKAVASTSQPPHTQTGHVKASQLDKNVAPTQQSAQRNIDTKKQGQTAQMLPAAGQSNVNSSGLIAMGITFIAIGLFTVFTRVRKTN